jgi:hypothetical protein
MILFEFKIHHASDPCCQCLDLGVTGRKENGRKKQQGGFHRPAICEKFHIACQTSQSVMNTISMAFQYKYDRD